MKPSLHGPAVSQHAARPSRQFVAAPASQTGQDVMRIPCPACLEPLVIAQRLHAAGMHLHRLSEVRAARRGARSARCTRTRRTPSAACRAGSAQRRTSSTLPCATPTLSWCPWCSRRWRPSTSSCAQPALSLPCPYPVPTLSLPRPICSDVGPCAVKAGRARPYGVTVVTRPLPIKVQSDQGLHMSRRRAATAPIALVEVV